MNNSPTKAARVGELLRGRLGKFNSSSRIADITKECSQIMSTNSSQRIYMGRRLEGSPKNPPPTLQASCHLGKSFFCTDSAS